MEKDIKVNGVDLRLKKLDAFEQYEMMDILYPVAVEVISTTTAKIAKMQGIQFIGFVAVPKLKTFPSDMRRHFIFYPLLNDQGGEVLLNGH